MVGVGIGKIALLLLSLSLFSVRGDSALTNNKLQSIMKQMFNRFDKNALKSKMAVINQGKQDEKISTGQQYSLAFFLSKEDCEKGQLGNNIPADFKEIRDTIAQGNVYQKNNVLAAIPFHHYDQNKEYTGTDHSEYRILTKLNEENINREYLIIYTYFSPCFKKCLKQNHKSNIINLLKDLKNKNEKTEIVLVFSSLFHYDRNDNTKDVIYNKLKEIPVPVYCCYERRGGSVVCAMFDRNKDKDQHCLSEKKESH